MNWGLESGIVAALGFALGASFWWLYFDYLDGGMLLGRAIALLGGGLDPLPVLALIAADVVGAVAIELATHQRHAGQPETAPSAEPV